MMTRIFMKMRRCDARRRRRKSATRLLIPPYVRSKASPPPTTSFSAQRLACFGGRSGSPLRKNRNITHREPTWASPTLYAP
eukprot:scaffold1095_cov126-Skeletonema_marinoi.AAC.2